MIKATCAKCGYNKDFDDLHRGRTFRCPKCSAPVRIIDEVTDRQGETAPSVPESSPDAPATQTGLPEQPPVVATPTSAPPVVPEKRNASRVLLIAGLLLAVIAGLWYFFQKEGSERELIAEFTINFNEAFSMSVPTEIGTSYEMEVSGTWAVHCDAYGEMDAAFDVNRGNSPFDPDFIRWNGEVIRPTPDFYDASHQYTYYNLTAETATQEFSFIDEEYSDNCGAVTIRIYKSVTQGVATTDKVDTAKAVNLSASYDQAYAGQIFGEIARMMINEDLSAIPALYPDYIEEFHSLKGINRNEVVAQCKNYWSMWRVVADELVEIGPDQKGLGDFRYTRTLRITKKADDSGTIRVYELHGHISFDAQGKIIRFVDEKSTRLEDELEAGGDHAYSSGDGYSDNPGIGAALASCGSFDAGAYDQAKSNMTEGYGVEYYYNTAWQYVRANGEGSYDAVVHFTEAIRQNPSNGALYSDLGNCYRGGLQCYAAAEMSYTLAIDNGYRKAFVYYNRAICRYEIGELAGMRIDFAEAQRLGWNNDFYGLADK